MEYAVPLALHASGPLINNSDKIYGKTKEKAKQGYQKLPVKKRQQNGQDQNEGYNDMDYSRRVDSDRQRDRYVPRGYYDDDKVEDIPREFPPPQGNTRARAKSAGRDGYSGGGARGRGVNQRRGSRRDYSSESESSISPAPRDRRRRKSLSEQALAAVGLGGAAGAGAGYAAGRDRDNKERSLTRRRTNTDDYGPRPSTNSTVATSTRDNRSSYTGGRRSSSTSTTSSSDSEDLGSSTDDEKKEKKIKRSELITAGLAAVATVHAASGVYNSMQASEGRHEGVLKGEMTPEEARKERNKARLQDAAAIGIAALGIKGAYSKWQSTHAQHQGLKQHKQSRKERHEKRAAKASRKQNKSRGGSPNGRPGYGRAEQSYRQSEPDLRGRYQNYGSSRYNDGNPYGNLPPPPPMGQPARH